MLQWGVTTIPLVPEEAASLAISIESLILPEPSSMPGYM
jgi:hypothetical protein